MFTFVETPHFSRIVGDYLSDEELATFELALASNPDLGVLIPASGGLRKVRWRYSGRGKRGGVRIIYYVKRLDALIWLLSIYAKTEREDLDHETLLKLRKEIDG
jgi:mRNA-degrading endonuclease RelE of RelBE toxin-antitoxin system